MRPPNSMRMEKATITLTGGGMELEGREEQWNPEDDMSEEKELVDKLFPTLVAELDTRFTPEQIASVNIGIKYCREELLKALQGGTLSLESRLKEAEKKFNDANELCGQKHDKMLEFQQRLSQAEAEKEGLKKEIIDYIEASGKLHRREIQDMKDFKRKFTDVAIESLDKENKELRAELSHLMDVAGKLFKSLELMLEDAVELRVIKARDLGEERDRRIHATYYEDIDEAKLALAEWDGIKEGGK